MDSVNVPIERRRRIWDRLATDLRPRDLGAHATEVTLDTLEAALDGIVAGAARGRWIVRVDELGSARLAAQLRERSHERPAGVLAGCSGNGCAATASSTVSSPSWTRVASAASGRERRGLALREVPPGVVAVARHHHAIADSGTIAAAVAAQSIG